MDAIVPLLVLTPLLVLAGGIALAIVRTLGKQRQLELLQPERIAAIERGADPQSLPVLSALGLDGPAPDANSARLARNLMIGGVICVAFGVGLVVLFLIVEDEGAAWALGIVPCAIGLGLLTAAALVRPRRVAGPRSQWAAAPLDEFFSSQRGRRRLRGAGIRGIQGVGTNSSKQ